MRQFSEDSKLIENLRKGDVDAFNMVYKKYAQRLYAFSLKYLQSVEEAEELVQSVFLKLWENQENLKKETSFKSYLFTIAYNEICNLFRRRKYQKEYTANIKMSQSDSSDAFADQLSYRSILQQVEVIIERLPGKQKAVFIKSRIEGKSTKEIASELGFSPGTVDNYVSEAVKFIRSNLEDDHLALLLFIALFFV